MVICKVARLRFAVFLKAQLATFANFRYYRINNILIGASTMTTLDDIAALLRQQNDLLQRFMLLSTVPTEQPRATAAVKTENEQRAEAAYQRMLKRKSNK